MRSTAVGSGIRGRNDNKCRRGQRRRTRACEAEKDLTRLFVPAIEECVVGLVVIGQEASIAPFNALGIWFLREFRGVTRADGEIKVLEMHEGKR